MNKKYGIITSISLLVFAAAAVTAAPPTSYYLPLETNDPTCAPGDLNCDVELNFLTTEVDGDITNEIQDLSLSGSTLSLSGSTGAPIDLSSVGAMNTDDQALTLSGSVLSLEDGGDVNLSSLAGMGSPWYGSDDNMSATLNTENMYSLGRVGIGATSVTGKLHVSSDLTGSGTLANIVMVDEGGDAAAISAYGTGLGLWGNASLANIGTEPMVYLTDSTNVGIGTINPQTKLHVNGAGQVYTRIESTSDSWMGLQLESGATSSGSYLIGIRPGGDYAIRNNSGTGPLIHHQINNETGNHLIAPTAGIVGIGTTSPSAQLTINTITSIGALEAGSNAQAIGNDSVAFGRNSTSTGAYSISAGDATSALGSFSAAFGRGTTSEGFYSLAAGDQSTTIGNYSAVLGRGNTAAGLYSFAHGQNSIASGNYSFANGFYLNTDSFAEFAVGRYNTPSLGSPTSWIPTEPLFVVGNGTGTGSTSNAVTVLKNGRVGIGIDDPERELHVNGQTLLDGKVFLKPATGFQGQSLSMYSADEANITNLHTYNGGNFGIRLNGLSNDQFVIQNGVDPRILIGAIGGQSVDMVIAGDLAVTQLPSGTDDTVAPGVLAGAVCITSSGNMYIDTDGTCAN